MVAAWSKSVLEKSSKRPLHRTDFRRSRERVIRRTARSDSESSEDSEMSTEIFDCEPEEEGERGRLSLCVRFLRSVSSRFLVLSSFRSLVRLVTTAVRLCLEGLSASTAEKRGALKAIRIFHFLHFDRHRLRGILRFSHFYHEAFGRFFGGFGILGFSRFSVSTRLRKLRISATDGRSKGGGSLSERTPS